MEHTVLTLIPTSTGHIGKSNCRAIDKHNNNSGEIPIWMNVQMTRVYGVVLALHKFYKLACGYAVNVKEMIDRRSETIRGLVMFQLIMPVLNMGMLVHELVHVYDNVMCILAGPAYTYCMYIFERLVSWLARQIYDRAQPERNLANNVAFGIGLANRVRCQQSELKEEADSIGGTAEKTFRKLGLLEEDPTHDQALDSKSAYTLPKRIAIVPSVLTWQLFILSWGRFQATLSCRVY
jgi:hypothetical protein